MMSASYYSHILMNPASPCHIPILSCVNCLGLLTRWQTTWKQRLCSVHRSCFIYSRHSTLLINFCEMQSSKFVLRRARFSTCSIWNNFMKSYIPFHFKVNYIFFHKFIAKAVCSLVCTLHICLFKPSICGFSSLIYGKYLLHNPVGKASRCGQARQIPITHSVRKKSNFILKFK